MRYVVCDVIIGVVDSREGDVIRVYISSRHSFYHNHSCILNVHIATRLCHLLKAFVVLG